MSITIFHASILICFFASTVLADYQLDTTFDASNIFTKFNFWTDKDPTNGYVDYQSYSSALASKLVDTVRDADGSSVARIKVDSTSIPKDGARGRKSIRITSDAKYNHGLFIADILHMPSSTCGAWPALWQVGPNWVRDGEVDIIEGISEATVNTATLHADGSEGTCVLRPDEQSGQVVSPQCDNALSGNSGCGVAGGEYGTKFNNNGDGVYAMEWLSESIKIWYFARQRIPADISSGTPDPSRWGAPLLKAGGRSCDIDAHFRDMSLVIDTTFCGDLAGQPELWRATSCYRSNPVPENTCQRYVQNNPRAYANAFWSIKSIKVYQQKKSVVVPKPKSSATLSSRPATSSIRSRKITSIPKPTILKPTIVKPSQIGITVIKPTLPKPTILKSTMKATIVKPSPIRITVTRPKVPKATVFMPKSIQPTLAKPTIAKTSFRKSPAFATALFNLAVPPSIVSESITSEPTQIAAQTFFPNPKSIGPSNLVATPSATISIATTASSSSIPSSTISILQALVAENYSPSPTSAFRTKATSSSDVDFLDLQDFETSSNNAGPIRDTESFALKLTGTSPSSPLLIRADENNIAQSCNCKLCGSSISTLRSIPRSQTTISFLQPIASPFTSILNVEHHRSQQVSSGSRFEIAESLMSVVLGLFFASVLYFFVEHSV